MYLKEDELHLQKNYIKKATSVSNNIFERKLYSGFQQSSLAGDFVFLSAPSVGWFPVNCKKMVMKGFSKKQDYLPAEYITTYIGSTFSKSRALKKMLKNVLKTLNLKNYKVCLVINELHLPYLRCAEYIKKRTHDSITVQLVPDLPEFNNRSKNFIYNFLKKVNCNKISKLRKRYIDKYVLFSKSMANRLGISKQDNWIVNYGIAPDKYQYLPTDSGKIKHVVFIGKIDKRNGVNLILEVANMFASRNDVVFDFYGIGASDAVSNDFAFNCSNVIIHGFVNPSEISSILCSADVLLSPRYPNAEYTKYSFPSKIFEYLRAYKPVVTFKLDCYPEELDQLLIYPESVTGKALFDAIQKAFITQVDVNAIDSFLSKYTKEIVVERIVEFAERT